VSVFGENYLKTTFEAIIIVLTRIGWAAALRVTGRADIPSPQRDQGTAWRSPTLCQRLGVFARETSEHSKHSGSPLLRPN